MKLAFFILACFSVALQGQGDSVIYSPIGKRDPFRMPSAKTLTRDVASVNQLERFSLEQIQLRAILKGLGKNRAMFEDPEGKTHILLEGSQLGRERATVSRILSREVIVTVRTFNYLGNETLVEKIMSLPTEDEEINTTKVPETPVTPKSRGER